MAECAQRNGMQEWLTKLFEAFPYPLQIFSSDGTSRMINDAAVEMIGIVNKEDHVGNYNVFEDPLVRKLGVTEKVKEALKGKIVYITDFLAPYDELILHFNLRERNLKYINADITCFPLVSDDGKIEYFAAVFIFKDLYMGKEEVELGKQYLKSHWKEPFCADEIAKAVHMSKSHFYKAV